jgi:hypothetical protein
MPAGFADAYRQPRKPAGQHGCAGNFGGQSRRSRSAACSPLSRTRLRCLMTAAGSSRAASYLLARAADARLGPNGCLDWAPANRPHHLHFRA